MKEVLTLKTSSIGFPVISVQMSCTGSPDNNMLHVSPGQKRTGERQGKNHCTKKKKRWGKQRVTSKLKKQKQKGKVLKTKGQRFGSGISECQMPLLFSTWRGDVSLREAENVTFNLRNSVILVCKVLKGWGYSVSSKRLPILALSSCVQDLASSLENYTKLKPKLKGSWTLLVHLFSQAVDL